MVMTMGRNGGAGSFRPFHSRTTQRDHGGHLSPEVYPVQISHHPTDPRLAKPSQPESFDRKVADFSGQMLRIAYDS
jgi:hypothetical protein